MSLVKTEKEIQNMRESGKILSALMDALLALVKPGINLLELEALARKFTKDHGAESAFLGYEGYKHHLCLSVNDEVVHCPPRDYVFQNGDIVAIDAGVKYRGMYTDMARSRKVGSILSGAKKLLRVTQEALRKAEGIIRPGIYIGDIGHAVQSYVEAEGFSVVKDLVGHGIGTSLHEEPRIPNFGDPGKGIMLQAGMCLAIEPMVNMGSDAVLFEPDGWRIVTKDKSLSAHFEDTLVVRNYGCDILTQNTL